MTTEFAIYWGQQTVKTAIIVAAPILLGGMTVGLIVGIFQSATSIQEMTLTFIPKMAVVILIILFMMPWMLETLTDFTRNMFSQMALISK
ncbi:MAG: flagellar biosynthesis protein FliQ [Calditrichaeota bacterium]|nr:flagellar biosynthesis protein FliQ [Calditrichota bacterium]